MPRPEGRHTLPGTKLPAGDLPPTLVFHKWQRWDCFVPEPYIDQRGDRQSLKAFSQEETGHDFLSLVASRVQAAGRDHYKPWYRRFSAACEAVDAEKPVTAVTSWRMVVGWATNPAWEVGLTLDHLHGFPYVPGSAVKGLLHRLAELDLADGMPAPPEETPKERFAPPPELFAALDEALQVRALFGSLHLRPQGDQPSSALVALERWRDHARRLARRDDHKAEWADPLTKLETVCSDAAAGGMVACFDAVPAADSFKKDQVLTVDVLTPHTGASPIPILFLAVRDGVSFEFRYRLASLPATEPRDPEEAARTEALAGVGRKAVLERLRDWLVRGLAEHGLGGKTSAGYGYLRPPGDLPRLPPFLQEPARSDEDKDGPDEHLTDAEREAIRILPDGISPNDAINYLDQVLDKPASPGRTAVILRFVTMFPDEIESWQVSKARSKIKRTRLIREILDDEEDDG